MVRILLILFYLLFADHSFSIEASRGITNYNYDVINTLSEGLVHSYDSRSNGIIKCENCDIESTSEKTLDGSFFAFEVGLVATKGIDDGVMAGSVGATRVWTKKGRLKAIGLPTTGKIRFVPRKGYDPSNPLARGPNKGILDRFGNEWTKGPSRTKGQAFEWDVQLSKTGRQKLGWASRDGSHVNVSLDGRITHK